MAQTKSDTATTGSEEETSIDNPSATGSEVAFVNFGGRQLAAYDFGEDAGAGFEDMSVKEQLIPFITILQGLSPQVDRSGPDYIEGAQIGMLFETASKELYDIKINNPESGIPFIPCWREETYTEWVPRNDVTLPKSGKVIRGGSAGNGFRGIHKPDEPAVREAMVEAQKEFGRSWEFRPLPFYNVDQNEETILLHQFNIGIVYGWPELDEMSAQRAMVAFVSTKIPVYQAFMSTAKKIRYMNPSTGKLAEPSLYSHQWRLGVVPQENNKGKFYNYRINLQKPLPWHNSLVRRDSVLFALAKEFHEQWREGQVKGDYASATEAAGSDSSRDGQAPSSGHRLDDEIPF
jgi:hypothetical protein